MTIDDEETGELAAYRAGADQLAYDKPHLGQPIIVLSSDDGEPVEYLQRTYRGEPAWFCCDCFRVSLGVILETCHGCGRQEVLSEILHGAVSCPSTNLFNARNPEGETCLILGSDGCECPDD